jgi:hypothetical protein
MMDARKALELVRDKVNARLYVPITHGYEDKYQPKELWKGFRYHGSMVVPRDFCATEEMQSILDEVDREIRNSIGKTYA